MLSKTTPESVHRVCLVVAKAEQEVVPGVRQTRWTAGSTAPAPMQRGKVVNKSVATLAKDGSIGHSIDSQTGALAPNRPLCRIAPGEEQEYRLTATSAGIWISHCSMTLMPMHFALGRFCVVISDPPNQAPAAGESVLVQSETYLGPHGGTVDAITSGER